MLTKYVLITPVDSSRISTLISIGDNVGEWVYDKSQVYFAHIDTNCNYTIFTEDFSTRTFSSDNNGQSIDTLFKIIAEFKVKIDVTKMKEKVDSGELTYKELLESMKLVNNYVEMVEGYTFSDIGITNAIKLIYPHSMACTLGLYDIIKF